MKDRWRRTRFDRTGTGAITVRRESGGWRPNQPLAGLVFILKWHREPSLDTPNLRPPMASSQGPKITHDKPPDILRSPRSQKILPAGTRHPLKTFSETKLSLSRCSPEIHQILYSLI